MSAAGARTTAERRAVRVCVDGHAITVPEGTNLAAAIASTWPRAFRRSLSGEPRWPLCGMGICFECRVRLEDGRQVRSCMVICREGMRVSTCDG